LGPAFFFYFASCFIFSIMEEADADGFFTKDFFGYIG
jgi:hypothetical protein